MFEIIVWFSVSTTILLGIGVLIVACYYVWDFAVSCILKLFKIHGLFIRFVSEYNKVKNGRPSVIKPEIFKKEEEERK